MNQYVTATIIKELREKNNMTQLQLAEKLGVSDKCVSKWERCHGMPDITLLEPIAKAFRISVTELISGTTIHNANVSSNMLRSKFYVCPVCGNVIHSRILACEQNRESIFPSASCAFKRSVFCLIGNAEQFPMRQRKRIR